jgi:hypothetical protein
MPYDESFRKQTLDTISNLKGEGQLYRRKKHTLDMILSKYTHAMQMKHTLLGNTILNRMQNHITEIFNSINETSNYEVLEYVNNIVKWYFKLLGVRKTITGETKHITIPDYTIPEIKEIHDSITY